MGPELIRIGILTVSDRVCRGEYEDRSGPAVAAWLVQVVTSRWEAVARRAPDELGAIVAALTELADVEGCSLVLTTGGTGPAERDVTPEATAAVCQRMLPGLGEAMRRAAGPTVPTAMLGRQTAGVRGSTLIINLPGSPRAVGEGLAAVFPAVPHCLELLGRPSLSLDRDKIAYPHVEH
jgi:molybdopterin adenylyltransferase